ncbi:hypothetical protein GF382_03895 [Candidatus Falkowbacteria bacterium]|nr:hypothetical protein [Candidatus Falkowbacteria bacterium]
MKKNNKQVKKSNFSFKLIKSKISESKGKAVIILTLAILIINAVIFLPLPTVAEIKEISGIDNIAQAFKDDRAGFVNTLPKNSDSLEVSYVRNVVLTAYNSEVAQCDSSPCITANGFNVCKHGIEDTIAMNGIRMGTRIRIPELFGDRVFVVRDRMNAKYDSSRGDIWMISKDEARQFGVKYALIEVLK